MRGQILAELMIAIAITAVLAAIGAQLLNVGLYSAGTSEDRQAASRLAEEVFESLRAITFGNTTSTQGWNNLYLPPTGGGDIYTSKGDSNLYHTEIVNNNWKIVSGSEIVILDNGDFTRSFIIENICRDNSTADISTTTIPCLSGFWEDPGYQKVTVTISKIGAPDFTFSQYFTRYLNESTSQENWGSNNCSSVIDATSTPTIYCNIDGKADANLNCVGVSTCLRIKQQ